MSEDLAPAARLVARSKLTHEDQSGMYQLLTTHFEGVTEKQFLQDTADKNWVILLERSGHLVGFTTILAYETSLDGEPISVIYSGDTIVSPVAWNASTLPRAWIESVAALRPRYPRGRYLWMLITSGFRTYRFLPLFWRDFYPNPQAPTPAEWQRRLDHIAAERFGPRYDSASGIVRLYTPQRLRGDLAQIPEGRIADPHIAFFAQRNPGHARGDELVCLTELTPQNLTRAGRRMAAATPQW